MIQEGIIVNNDQYDTNGNLLVKPRPVDGTFHIDFVYLTLGQSGVVDLGDDGDEWQYTYTPTATTLRFQPSDGYYIDGGGFRVISENTMSGTIKAKVAIAPDIPEIYGGNKIIVENKKVLIGDRFELAVPPKYVQYVSGALAHVTQVTFTHVENENTEIEVYLRVYK